MWRRVTRGLVIAVLATLLSSAAIAQTDPIASLDFPDPSVPQSGVVLVKGWALDPQSLTKAELFVDDTFQQRLVSGLPRIDVEQAYPNYTGIHNTAPGFETGFLASRFTNGPHTVSVKLYYSNGTIFELGRRAINIDNTINQPPFGSVDIPDASGVFNASSSFPVVGWAADTDGISRVDVYVDNAVLQGAVYGDARPDVGETMPDFPASLFSGFIANVDTTRLTPGVHLLEVRATDASPDHVSRLIGRRQIQIFQDNGNDKPFGYLDEPLRNAVLYGTHCGTVPILSPPVNAQSHITPVRGWALDLGTRSQIGSVRYIELMIDGVRWYSTADCAFNPIFGTYVNCYGQTRFDVERYFPNYPDAPRSGFLFTVDIGALLALGVGPGPHNLSIRVGDNQGTFTELPTSDGIPVFFECAEDRVGTGVGFIDIPTKSDYVSGNVVFQGWAVSESAGINATVQIFIDGNFVGNAQYGFPRPDVQQAYPFLANSLNSGWRFTMDTTKLSDARHDLTVQVMNNITQQPAIIGSTYFYVKNNAKSP